ncbi:hypothetical protein D7V82_15005 [bacterium 1xD8-6]|nr:hypothetical protein D7V72_01670 [bacterium D16-36]RKI66345.1 hypothetical protein D7V82_15005 [bacterium 1xD8-6]
MSTVRPVHCIFSNFQQTIEKTRYLAEVHFSDTSTQSVTDKLKRIILYDLEPSCVFFQSSLNIAMGHEIGNIYAKDTLKNAKYA